MLISRRRWTREQRDGGTWCLLCNSLTSVLRPGSMTGRGLFSGLSRVPCPLDAHWATGALHLHLHLHRACARCHWWPAVAGLRASCDCLPHPVISIGPSLIARWTLPASLPLHLLYPRGATGRRRPGSVRLLFLLPPSLPPLPPPLAHYHDGPHSFGLVFFLGRLGSA